MCNKIIVIKRLNNNSAFCGVWMLTGKYVGLVWTLRSCRAKVNKRHNFYASYCANKVKSKLLAGFIFEKGKTNLEGENGTLQLPLCSWHSMKQASEESSLPPHPY